MKVIRIIIIVVQCLSASSGTVKQLKIHVKHAQKKSSFS